MQIRYSRLIKTIFSGLLALILIITGFWLYTHRRKFITIKAIGRRPHTVEILWVSKLGDKRIMTVAGPIIGYSKEFICQRKVSLRGFTWVPLGKIFITIPPDSDDSDQRYWTDIDLIDSSSPKVFPDCNMRINFTEG